MRIPPADLSYGNVRGGPVSVDNWTSFSFDTALIVGVRNLILHHGERPLDGGRNERRRHRLAVTGKFTSGTMAESGGVKLHQIWNRWTRCCRLQFMFKRHGKDCHGRQDRGGYERDAPSDQRGAFGTRMTAR